MSWKSFWLLLTETLTMALMSRVFFFFMRSESSGVWLSGGRSGDSMMRPAAAPLYLSLSQVDHSIEQGVDPPSPR